MVSDPGLIHYACIADGTTVLAESNSKDAALGAIAVKCLDNTPPFHARFTHTVRSRTYAFLIDGDFVYFSIFDERLDKSEGFAFLESVRTAFSGVWEGKNKSGPQKPSSHCFQGEMNPVFRQLLGSNLDHVEGLGSPSGQRLSQTGWFQSGSGPIRGRPKPKPGGEKGLKNMNNRFLSWDKERDEGIANSPTVHKSKGALYSSEISGHQKAKKVWKKHVWFILSLDLIICTILFCIWLWVCSGLKCIDS